MDYHGYGEGKTSSFDALKFVNELNDTIGNIHVDDTTPDIDSEFKPSTLFKRRQKYAEMNPDAKKSKLNARRRAYAEVNPEIKKKKLEARRRAYANMDPGVKEMKLKMRRQAYEEMMFDEQVQEMTHFLKFYAEV